MKYLALGSNLGDREAHLRAATAAIAAHMQLVASSPIYETEPWGYTDQPPFLNQVLAVETDLSPAALLTWLKRLERDLGRQPTFRYGPRVIDLDILLYDDLVLQTPTLTIPHPRLHERAFVLVPLADLAPDLVHPVLGRTIADLLLAVDRRGVRRRESGILEVSRTPKEDAMSQPVKPLKWQPDPNIGFTVSRRPDGGMNVVFHFLDEATRDAWRRFAEEHELDSDRLTRNLYDLRALDELPEEAIRVAVEVNSDPATRNLRVAVLVANEQVRQAVEEIHALTPGGGAEIRVFYDPEEAEAWLSQPISTIV